MQATETVSSACEQRAPSGPLARWQESRKARKWAAEKEQQAIMQRSLYDLRGLDYSGFHSPRSMEAARREQRLQRTVTWVVMSLVFCILAVGMLL